MRENKVDERKSEIGRKTNNRREVKGDKYKEGEKRENINKSSDNIHMLESSHMHRNNPTLHNIVSFLVKGSESGILNVIPK